MQQAVSNRARGLLIFLLLQFLERWFGAGVRVSDATALRVRQLFTQLVEHRLVEHVTALEQVAARAKTEQLRIVQQSIAAAKHSPVAPSSQLLPAVAAAARPQEPASSSTSFGLFPASAAASITAAAPAAPLLWAEARDSSDDIENTRRKPRIRHTIDLTGEPSDSSSDSGSDSSSESGSESDSASSSSDESTDVPHRKRNGRTASSRSARPARPDADASGVAPMELDEVTDARPSKTTVSRHPSTRVSKCNAGFSAAPMPKVSQPEPKNDMEEAKEPGASLAAASFVQLTLVDGKGELQRPFRSVGAMTNGVDSADRRHADAVSPPALLSPHTDQQPPMPSSARITRSASKPRSRDKELRQRPLSLKPLRRSDSATEAMAAGPPSNHPLPADHGTAASAADSAAASGRASASAPFPGAIDESLQALLTRSLEEMEAEMAAAGSPLSDTGQSN